MIRVRRPVSVTAVIVVGLAFGLSPGVLQQAPVLTATAAAPAPCPRPQNTPGQTTPWPGDPYVGNTVWCDDIGEAKDPPSGKYSGTLDLVNGGFAFDRSTNSLQVFIGYVGPQVSKFGSSVTAPYYEYSMRWNYLGTDYVAFVDIENTGVAFAAPVCGDGTVDAAGNVHVISGTVTKCVVGGGVPDSVEIDIPFQDVGGPNPLNGPVGPPTGVLGKPHGLTQERANIFAASGDVNPPGLVSDNGPDTPTADYDLSTANPRRPQLRRAVGRVGRQSPAQAPPRQSHRTLGPTASSSATPRSSTPNGHRAPRHPRSTTREACTPAPTTHRPPG